MTTALTPDVIAEIVRRLAQAFEVHINSMGPGELMSQENVGLVLGINSVDMGADCDEVGFLLKMGVLKKASNGRVAPADLLAFLIVHGDAWALGRMERLRGELRNIVASELGVEPDQLDVDSD